MATQVPRVSANTTITSNWGNLTSFAVSELQILPVAKCQVSGEQINLAHGDAFAVFPFTSEQYDPLNWHSNTTNNSRITPTIAGFYRVSVNFSFGTGSDYIRLLVDVYKNGGLNGGFRIFDGIGIGTGATQRVMSLATPLIQINGTGDYFEVRPYQLNTSTGTNVFGTTCLVELVAFPEV